MVTISLKQSAAGGWRVCRCRITLFSDLQLGAAIKLAREMARDDHQRLGRRVRVEMPGPISTILLARYADDGTEGEANTCDTLAARALFAQASKPRPRHFCILPARHVTASISWADNGSTELLAMGRCAA